MAKELLKPQQFAKAEYREDENDFRMSPEEVTALAQLYEGTFSPYKRGSIISGTVLSVGEEGVLIDINFKSEGMIPLHEFTDHELKKFLAGSRIDVMLDEFENMEGNIIVSYQKAKALRAWEALMKLYSEGKPVEGVVLHKVKGGLNVDIGVPAFLPGSQVDIQRVSDFDHYVGQTITAYILKVNPRRGNVIISRRKYLNEQRSEVRKKILEQLEAGQVIQGRVKNIANFGAFIDIGGADGLLHITDMTWGRIAHPSELVKIGDTVTVKVLSFDKTTEKISLGLKQLEVNPWEVISTTVAVGSRIKGTISSFGTKDRTDYGLFVEVAKGVEGLVHISEISWSDRISDLHKHFRVGQEIEALVVSLDKDIRRMSLSIKQLEKNPWDTVSEQFAVNQQIKGKVTNVTDFGLFVQIVPGIDGLVHISDISWTEHIKNPADLYGKGQEVDVVITDINRAKKKISLSVKHLSENPWEQIEQKYPAGSSVEGEVSRLAEAGAFVRLPAGIEGFIHISEIPAERGTKVDELLKIGQRATFRVVKVSQDEHKVGLSLKPEQSEQEGKREREQRAHQREQHRERQAKREESAAGAKPKSQLQLELEKHAARLQESNVEGERR
jgi:small subunit ribosomal protein S1